MTKNNKIRQSRGMTLVELMISMVILSIILAFAVGLFVTQQDSSSKRQKHMQLVQRGRGAMQLLEYRLREIKTVNTADASNLAYTDINGVTFRFYLNGTTLMMEDATHTVALGNPLPVANEVSRFIFTYSNNMGTVLTPNPLTAAQRATIRQVSINLVLRSTVPKFSHYPNSLTGFVALRN
jgi:prepilin-type N-terminal cleavage/methylation domain-containing protein